MAYGRGSVVVLKSGYTGHMFKAEILGATKLFSNGKFLGNRGLMAQGLQQSGVPDAFIYSAWPEDWVVRRIRRNEHLTCPHCEMA